MVEKETNEASMKNPGYGYDQCSKKHLDAGVSCYVEVWLQFHNVFFLIYDNLDIQTRRRSCS